VEPEEYSLAGEIPLGTVVGPGRYGMHWVARRHFYEHEAWPHTIRTAFRMTLPSDMLAVANKPEPDSVTEINLRQQRRKYGASISNT
jgi:hypothetical protein